MAPLRCVLHAEDPSASPRTRQIAVPNCSQGPIYSAEFEAQRTGEVLLFVNDVMPLIWPELIPEKAAETRDVYQNNRGEAEVTIAPVPTYPPAPLAPP